MGQERWRWGERNTLLNVFPLQFMPFLVPKLTQSRLLYKHSSGPRSVAGLFHADEAPVLGVRPTAVKAGTAVSHLSCSNLRDSADVIHLLSTGGSIPLDV
jgi:hypothetical protein